MAGYRKLSRTADQRKALIRSQVTALIQHGKIVTTEAKAKEIRKVAEGLIAMAVREKDNFETVTVTAKVARKDKDGKRVKEVVNGKKTTVYDEVQKIAEGIIAMAVREKDNYEEVTVKAKVARKDKDGKRVKEVVDGKKVTVYDEVEKTIKKDMPSRLHARREMLKVLYPVTEVPAQGAGRKKNTKEVDLVAKLFDEIAPKYENRNGGYTRIVKIGLRKGDAAMEVLLELV